MSSLDLNTYFVRRKDVYKDNFMVINAKDIDDLKRMTDFFGYYNISIKEIDTKTRGLSFVWLQGP